MTDTGAYSDVVFGLFRLLGYSFSPRLADIGGTRFWRADPKADYGKLNAISQHKHRHSVFFAETFVCAIRPRPAGVRSSQSPLCDTVYPSLTRTQEVTCLLSASDTSYPLLNTSPSARELDEAFTPNLFELAFAGKHSHLPQWLVGLLLLLKRFSGSVGYFVQVMTSAQVIFGT